jgi:hypothetical protein
VKAWLVSSGTYSEYSVIAVFSTEEKALDYVSRYKLAAAGPYDTHDLRVEEERDLDPEGPPLGTLGFQAFVSRAGDIECLYRTTRGSSGHYKVRARPPIDDPELLELIGGPTDRSDSTGWIIWVFARDEEHAKKIVTEKRQHLLAQEALGLG